MSDDQQREPRDPGDAIPDPMPDDDPTAARLRAALNAEAAMVQPDDQLSTIRERTAGDQRPWWQRAGVVAVAAAVVLGLAAGGAAALLGGDDDPTVAAGGRDSTSAPPSKTPATPSETPSTSEGTATPTSAVPVEGNVFVYYAMDDGSQLRLFREERPNIGMDPVTMALTTMLSEPASDPDYSSPWPDDTVVSSYAVTGDTATLDLSRFVQLGAAAEQIAVQQVVYTVTANDTSVKKVRLLVEGKAPRSGHHDWSSPVARAPRVEVQGLIWLLTPTEGATVSSPVEITGYGTAFEGTVSWEVRRQGADTVVAEGFTQGGSMGVFADFSDSVVLEPGTYELRAFESSAENGEPIHVDSKTFTVE